MPLERCQVACHCAVVAFVAIVTTFRHASADALVVTRAMKASTIAEIFVDGQQVRVEIEIGAVDVPAFANVLPDEVYEKVTGNTRPFDDRVRTFFESDWVIQADGQPLLGKLEQVIPKRRVVRDEVTGEALAVQPADMEMVIGVALRYELTGHPQSLTIRRQFSDSDATANIGFVCYHDGLPANDFRYLPDEVTLDLDWADPWYSRFRNPNLRRQFDAPLSAYLYIEPYEVRKEIIVRPKDMQAWLDLGLRDDGVIPIGQQEEVKNRVAGFLSTKNPVAIDGRTAQGRLDRIHFIHRTLRTTGVIEPPVDLDADSATLGVIFVYPVSEWPDQVSMTWELFTPKITTIPVIASDEAGGLPSTLAPDDPVLVWRNYLIDPTSPSMIGVDLPEPTRIAIPVISVVCLGAGLLLFAIGVRWAMKGGGLPRGMRLVIAISVLMGVVCFPYARASLPNPIARKPAPPPEEAKNVLHALLYNVYRAFDHHDETLVYDRLALSISGDLLSDVYLQVRRSTELESQGGARVKVDDVTVLDVASESEFNGAGPIYQCRWTAGGTVGHWGHIHRRVNCYDAVITIKPVDGVWKITEIDLREERRVDPTPPS